MAKQKSGTQQSDRPYWNMEVEPLFGTAEMKAIQLDLLKRTLKRKYETAPFWRKRMEKQGAKPSQLTRLEDLPKMLPPLTKEDLRDLVIECGFDMNQVLAQMSGNILGTLRLMAATSGTTGEPTPYPMTEYDIYESFGEAYARVWWRAGVRPGDRVLHAFALSMFVAGVPMLLSNIRLGACVVPVGAEVGAERILRNAQLFGATVMNCTPSLADHLIERAPSIIGAPVSSLGIKTLVCGGEPGAGLPEVRRKLESAYGAKLFDFGALYGGSCAHPEYQGMHFVGDDLCLLELFDPETKEPVPLEDGARGEGCTTTLKGESLSGIRVSQGDIFEVRTSPCPCGQTGLRYRIVGRTDDMLKVKGAMVYPAAISDLIAGFSPRVTGAFRIVLDEPPPRVVPPLKLKVEYSEGVAAEDLPALEREILEAMHGKLRIRPAITWLAPSTLERSVHKTQLIERNY